MSKISKMWYAFVAVAGLICGIYTYHTTNSTAAVATDVPVQLAVEVEVNAPPTKIKVIHKISSLPAHYSESASFEDNLTLAHRIATDTNVNPTIIQGIMVTESNAGKAANLVSRGSYGLMQIQLVAARSILKRYPDIKDEYYPAVKLNKISDESLAKLLLKNREANIKIACYHLLTYSSLSGGDWKRAVVAYNMGIGNALHKSDDSISNNKYLATVKARISDTVYEFNNNHNLPSGEDTSVI